MLLRSRYLRPRSIRDMRSSWGHLHSRRRKLYRRLHISGKWDNSCSWGRRCAASPLVNAPQLTVGRSEQIRKFWSAYKPTASVSLKVFQTPPSSIIVPGLAGMMLRICFSVIHPAPQMPIAISSIGVLRNSFLSKIASRYMVFEKRMLGTLVRRLMLVCRCASKD
jgi:hypothetical protein